MKIQKNKIVFALVIFCVLAFIFTYGLQAFGKKEPESIENSQPPVPKLEDDGQKTYSSRLEAVDELKEKKATNAPSIYDDHLLDSLGYYQPQLDSLNKKRMIDSVYTLGQQRYQSLQGLEQVKQQQAKSVGNNTKIDKATTFEPVNESKVQSKEIALNHLSFFDDYALDVEPTASTDPFIYVTVDGMQTVKKGHRLRMRLLSKAMINGVVFPKHTPIYGFVSMQPNRVQLKVSAISHHRVKLKAFDLQDGAEGIYIKNSIRAQTRQQLAGDIVDDISIAGVPQVQGLKSIFHRDNRNVKVTILDQYQLILKPEK
ncbi:Protein of unknown function [Zhouia amylolytica]|uniref:Conjugative transposon TraM C-terminal domain-containing protein n=1 Tax=Zhouia amylolytica TaxID=376730 RepID=A0A1I6T4L7_9FLAO|nr:conjugative transposon protein TraM [Zhouia amylolytica]SFS84172.1 Protein of unknown function [Zhouia amylolytica]